MEISQISLAEVTDQYLESVGELANIPTQDLSDFLLVASTLLLIKSRILLPDLAISTEEEQEISDLETRLKEYRRYKEASLVLRNMLRNRRVIFARPLWQGFAGGFFPPAGGLAATELRDTLRAIVRELAEYSVPLAQKTIERVISVEERIKEILLRVERTGRFYLEDIHGRASKKDIVISFLAILFLFRTKAINLSQSVRFGPIEVSKEEN